MNLIQLKDEDEHLRDSLFWNIHKKDLLFDDHKTGYAYHTRLVNDKSRPPVPNIYIRTGERILANGALDPTPGRGTLPKSLPFVYGDVPSPELIEKEKCERGISYVPTSMSLKPFVRIAYYE